MMMKPFSPFYVCINDINAFHYQFMSTNLSFATLMQSPPEVRSIIQEASTAVSSECGKALKELASALRKMTKSSAAEPHIANSKDAAENLKSVIRSSLSKHDDILQIIPAGAVASLLCEVVKCTEEIADAAHKLASLAHFKNAKPKVTPEQKELPSQGIVQPVSGIDGMHHVITINEPSQSLQENRNLPPAMAPRMEV